MNLLQIPYFFFFFEENMQIVFAKFECAELGTYTAQQCETNLGCLPFLLCS